MTHNLKQEIKAIGYVLLITSPISITILLYTVAIVAYQELNQ